MIAGFDLTFKAPKSVSVLFAASDELADVMSAAHETAVSKALAAFEDYAVRVRRGHNGTQAERDAGLERGWETARSLRPEGCWSRATGIVSRERWIRICTRTC